MNISKISSYNPEQRNINKNVSSKGARQVISSLANPDSLMTTVVLESFVTGGRSLNALNRGGFYEFRECFTDNVLSAIFWMKGVDIFNKIGDSIGKNILKLPTTNFDVGKDALRTPFNNLIEDIGKSTTDTQSLKGLEKKLAAFKFSKIIIATILATGFVGFALPKINQAITRMMIKNKKETKETNKQTEKIYNPITSNSFEEFEKNIIKKQKEDKNPSFNGISPSLLTSVAHNLESQPIVKMLTNDLGILSGRIVTARNPDEGVEYLFRDATSSFFYFASTPIVYKLLQTITNSSKVTDIDPVAAKLLTEKLAEQLKDSKGSYTTMKADEFAAKALGKLSQKSKDLMSKLEFNSDVISLKELCKHISDKDIIKKATEMAKLQPEQANIGAVLTRQQVADVLKEGSITSPDFMQKIYKSKFKEALTDRYKYISMNKITKFRTNIDKYVMAIQEKADKVNGGVVDQKLLEKIGKKSFLMSAGFRIAAISVSAIFLGIIIPKLQYKLTEKRTGKNAAPGLREFEQTEKKEDKKTV